MSDIKDAGSNLARDFRRWVADTRSHVAAIRDGAEEIPSELCADRRTSRCRDPAAGILADRSSSPWASCSWAMASSSLLDGHSGLAQACAGHRRSTRCDSGWTWSASDSPTTCSGLLSFAVGSLGALLLFNWPPYLKTAAQRDLPDHRRRRPVGCPGALPAFAQQPEAAGISHQRRLGPALEPLGRDPAGLVLRRLHGHAGAAGLRRRSAGAPADRLLPRAGPVRPRHGRPVAAPGAVSRRDGATVHRAFNVTLGVSVLFAAFWALWFFGMMKAFWLLLVVAGPAGGHQRRRPVGGPRSDAARSASRPRGRPACSAAALERGAALS